MQAAKEHRAADLSSLGLQWEWIGRTGYSGSGHTAADLPLPQGDMGDMGEGSDYMGGSGSNTMGGIGGMGEVHVQVLSPYLCGLDLRLTESASACR
jgi:hypothetical protein